MAKMNHVTLISNGDFRNAACVEGWDMQKRTIDGVRKGLKKLGVESTALPKVDKKLKHGFVTKQCEGTDVFSKIKKDEPIIVLLSIWAYSHHVSGALQTHEGPILLVGNFDGTWPGLVALLNHAGTLERLGVKHSRLWSEDFESDPYFMKKLEQFVESGKVTHSTKHITNADKLKVSSKANKFGEDLATEIKTQRRILGQMDPGCMGMLNAVMDPAKLGALGMPVEYLNQSDLLAEMEIVHDLEAQEKLNWLIKKGTHFDWGTDQFEHLVHGQVLSQMKMYIAAARIYERYGLSAIGIPYQYGLVRSVPASDLVEGMLNNSDRPDVEPAGGGKVINKGKPIVHFNEGDLGSAVPQLIMHDIYQRKNMDPETTLHDVRWGHDYDGKFTWVFLISGAAPPAHWNGWKNTKVFRQPKLYFPLGGGTCSGVSKPGTVTWARCWERPGEIWMDCGLGEVQDLPGEEVEERLSKTTPQWPIANVHIPGYDKNECMSSHMANHITIGYGDILQELVATCQHLGMKVRVAGDAREKLS